jgi:hypothetical protein
MVTGTRFRVADRTPRDEPLSTRISAPGRLASGGEDRIVQVYAMDIEVLMSLARSRVTRNLTLGECRKYLHRDEVPPLP